MVWASASLISREAFTNIGGFDENLSGYEDDDFWLRVFRAGYGNAFIPTALTRVRRHVNSCGRSSNMQRSRIIYARKLLEAFPDKPEMGQYFASKLIAPRFINLELRDFRAARRQGDAAAMALYLERLKSFEAYLTADTAKLISKVTKVPGWDDRLPSRKPKTRQIENKAVDRGDDVFQSLPVEPHRPITSDDVFAALQASLWEVRHPVVSACDEHFPFLFALVALVRPRTYVELGVHRGGSFFAVCQAVERLQLDATCIAIDNWIGDHHAGMHSEDVFDAFTDTLDQYYASFAGYIRRPFDLAAHQFELGSIDILHIDGFHSFEAVKKDFETWFDKLSDQGVVLFHDTNEFKSDFGVWRFWEQVSERYPSMEFGHGHGLGVLVVGEKSPLRNNVEGWSASLISGESVDLMRVLFSGLGRTSSKLSAHRRKRNSKSSERDEARIKMLEKTIASMKRSLSFRITAPLRTLKRKFRG